MKLTKDKADVFTLLGNLNKRLANAMKSKLINDFNQYKALSENHVLANFGELIDQREQKLDDMVHKLRLLSPSNIAKQYDDTINNLTERLNLSKDTIFNNCTQAYENLNSRLKKELVLDKIDSYNEKIDNLASNIDRLYSNYLGNLTNTLNQLLDKNVILNPFNIMKKGYSIVYKDDVIIDSVESVEKDDKLRIRFEDGSITASVNDIERNK